MNNQIIVKNERTHEIDWLRVLAFGLFFVFHSWRPIDHFPWHLKNEEQNQIPDHSVHCQSNNYISIYDKPIIFYRFLFESKKKPISEDVASSPTKQAIVFDT